ncbi:MAG: helix-turn-helix domain-containing protein [Clostridia bacterium]|nr:helix-turn-helix domain-containing protein [Clostridia bacterium]
MANYELSNRIYELRTQRGLSQKELGALLGVSNKAVSKWETGTAIPKTETLIKLADIFEISTEELLNTIHQEDSKEINSVVNSNNSTENICEEKIIVNKIDATQANAKEGKTLLEFRAERGLYIKDVAEKIGMDESELQEIENSGLVPDEIAEKLVVAYDLPSNDFAKPIMKSKKEIKKYFTKVACLFEIILPFIGTIPIVIGTVFVFIASMCDSDTMFDIAGYIGNFSILWYLFVTTIGCVKLGDYLTKRSGLLGDFNKHKFLYYVIPRGATAFISSISDAIVSYGNNDVRYVSYWICNGFDILLSLISIVLTVFVLVVLMQNSNERNIVKRRKTFKTIAIVVTVSALVAFLFDGLTDYIIYGSFLYFSPIQELPFYIVDIVIVWLVYFLKESNHKMERLVFVILPIISIWKIIISDIITLIF